MSYILGLDLGQLQDYTAIVIAEQLGKTQKDRAYHISHIERFRLGTPYPDVVTRVKELLSTEQLKGKTTLVVDATGVGVPVVDMLYQAGLSPIPILITGGDSVNSGGVFLRVPKRDLVSQLQVYLQSERLKIVEELPEARTLINELLTFKVKVTANAHDTYGAWREGAHDDLVLAAALAVWAGDQSDDDGVVEAEVLDDDLRGRRWKINW